MCIIVCKLTQLHLLCKHVTSTVTLASTGHFPDLLDVDGVAEPSDNRGCTFTTYYAARLVCCECEASVVRWLCHTIKSGSIIDISGTPELSGTV